MPTSPVSPFVSTAWLAERLGTPGIAIVDASWYLPAEGRDARSEYLAGHIPEAVFFDIDAISDGSTGLPHMMPSPDAFAEAVGALGIGDGMQIVVYDGAGLFSAPRVRWMFQTMGAPDVRILDGGLPKWRNEGLPLESGAVTPQPRVFTPRFSPEVIADTADVEAAIASGEAQIVDARSPSRFAGEEAEPRPGVRPGHIPGSRNVHYRSLLTPDGRLKTPQELGVTIKQSGVDLDEPIIATCGSGVTAAIVGLALESLGRAGVPIYDGSWSEWGSRTDLPVETGPYEEAGRPERIT